MGKKNKEMSREEMREIIERRSGARYVFYSSLKNEKSPIYQILYEHAKQAIEHYKIEFNNGVHNTSQGQSFTEAINFLAKSAEFERQKELQFFKNFETAHPEVKKAFNINADEILNDYPTFITNINRALKGTEQLKKELNTEINRIQKNNEAAAQYYQAINQGKQIAKMDKNFNKQQYENDLKKDLGKARGMNNALFSMKANGESAFNAIFTDKGKMTILSELIIERYGHKLFNKNLQLDSRQTNSLIAVLVMKANEILVSNLKLPSTQGTITETAESVIGGLEFEKFTNTLLNSPNLIETLNSIIAQYGMTYGDTRKLNDVTKKIERIKNALKKDWEKLKKEKKINTSFDTWLKTIGMDEDNIKQLIANAQTISAQCYYVGEDLSMLVFIANSIAAVLGGRKNPTDDIQAGTLITTFTFHKEKLDTLEQKLWKSQEKHFEKVGATGDYQSYLDNTSELLAARQEQQQLIEEFIQTNNLSNAAMKDLLSHINIHSTVKGYESAGSYMFQQNGGFGGAAFGATLDDQLDIINDMIIAGGLTELDIENLFLAMLNCGKLMIGHTLKPTIENYFSAFMGMFMFNDASLFAKDVNNWLNNEISIQSSVQDLHLYQLNGLVIPSSYILQETYNAMSEMHSFDNEYKGVRAKFTTYDKDYIKGDWEATTAHAIAETKLERMHFLAGFLDLLNSITDRLQNLG